MSFGFFLRIIILKFFQFLAWPPFTLVCPLYASIRAIESNTQSNYQQCLTYWVLYSVAKILESMLAKLLVWFPFWHYVKGITTFLLVVPYFHGASYIYLLLIKPYISGNSQICGHLLIPRTKACLLNEQNDILDAADSYIREIEEDEWEKSIIYKGGSKSNHDSIESDLIWLSSPEKVQERNTTSKKCMQKNFREEKHKGMEEERRRNEVAHETVSFPLTMEKEDGMTSLGNLNQTKWVNLNKLSSLFHPVTRSFGLCTWEKPEFGWTKLNTDGSVGRDNASFGGLLRDYNGDPICAYVSKIPINDIFLVELLAIWRGLVLALGQGIKVIWVESDSLSVVKTINKEQTYGPRASSYLKRIWLLLKKFEKYEVSHSWRETNRAADYLAKMDLMGSDVVLWPVGFPDSLCSIINEDAQGRWYRRVSLFSRK
ncbi:uncharacterized protein LOC114269753 isoform X1 [Camellia sinensis]|uniref:uncharacterized protein LOC114269753 isoform X1 n=1 Tax=Camellia sinensis TaxID=4442 RepID=UPI001036B3F1|nr:uncharacterized protein LOC114269753 isoform X1 [Camellia sinensis]